MNRSILIVDDEELIRKGIIARLDYLNLKPSALYEAENGLQALEIIKAQGIDIVITDIHMNDMDGLEFIKQAKPISPSTQFIIVSGYAEFEYAEQAIQLGVQAYLLKPISNDALKKVIEDSVAKLEEGESLRRTISEGMRSIEEKRGLEFEKSINALLRNSREFNDNNNAYDAVDKKFPIKGRWVMLGIINIDGDNFEQKNFEYKDIDLIQSSIKDVFMGLDSRCDKIIVNNLANSSQLFAVLSCREKQIPKEAGKLFTQLQDILWNHNQVSLTIGISSAADALSNQCTKEAQEAFLQRMIHGSFNLYFYDDIALLSDNQFPTSELNLLRQYIERHDAGNIEFLINEIFSDEQIKKYNLTYIRAVWISIVSILLKEANTFTDDPRNMEKLVINIDILESFQSLGEIRSYLYSLILECIDVGGSLDTNSKNKIKLAVKYINDNYNKDVSIDELSEKFGMSSNYFSTIFKRETGQTTVNYIKDIRIKKACDYLIHSDKSVVEIAKEVGYEDSQYFFRVFKKTTGQTPLQYKRDNS